MRWISRAWLLALLAALCTFVTVLGSADSAFALCSPGRPRGVVGSHYQGGVQAASVQLAGTTIDYYIPYVDQSSGSSSSAWQMLWTSACFDQNTGSYILAQAGFVQMTGDSQDYVFTESGTCAGGLDVVLEFPSKPRVTSRFNVYSHSSPKEVDMYQGSTLLQSRIVDWTANEIAVAAETHSQDDQGYGGTTTPRLFGQLQYQDRSGGFHNDSLLLTPNNVSSNNDSGLPWWSWLKMTLGSDSFYTYDSACTG